MGSGKVFGLAIFFLVFEKYLTLCGVGLSQEGGVGYPFVYPFSFYSAV